MSGTRLLASQSTTQSATQGTVATAAPGGAAHVSPAAAPGAGSGGAFDAILMLEELAASATAVPIDAGAAEIDAMTADPAEDTDGEDSVEDLDDPLAFLANLIAVMPHGNRRIATNGAGDSAVGAEGAAARGQDGATAATVPGALNLFDDGNAGGATASASGDAAAAARALSQAQFLAGETRPSEDAPMSARTLDLFAPGARAATATEHPPIATHVRDPRWAEEFGTRIAMLVNQRESVAALSLTPVDLGPVDVSVTVRDSQATIHFGAAQADTRALIEASLPKLRELLEAQGFQLLDASVSQGFTRQSRSDEPSVPRPSGVEEVTMESGVSVRLNGLLDTYA